MKMHSKPSTAVSAEQLATPVRSRDRILSPEELEARRADPQREEDDGVACRICGMVRKRLTGGKKRNHLLLKHGLANAREYHQYCQSRGWGTPPCTAVPGKQPARPIRVCKPAVKSQIVRWYKQGLTVRQVQAKVHTDVMLIAAVIREARLMRANGEARRGRPTPRSADKWRMVEGRIIEGKSTQEIAKELHRASPSNINRALRGMGWPFTGKPGHIVCHSFGEVLDRPALRQLKKMSGLDVAKLAQELSMRFATLRYLLNPTRLPGQELAFDTALKIRRWWENLFFSLMSDAPANPTTSHRFGKSSIVLAFFPKLRERYSLLLKVLQRLAEDLRKNLKCERHELEQHLCVQAMLEEAEEKAGRSPGHLFRRFLPWAPKLMPFLAEKLQDLRGGQPIAPIARKIIAKSLHTTEAMIWTVINEANRIRPISPQEMQVLILKRDGAESAVAQPQQPQPEAPKGDKPRRGRRGVAAEKRADYKVGSAVEQEIPLFKRLFEAKKATPASATLRSQGFTEQQIEAALPSRTPLIAARRFISHTYPVKVEDKVKLLDYNTVAKYHQRFVRLTRLPGTEIAA
jgi:hypothetical protein